MLIQVFLFTFRILEVIKSVECIYTVFLVCIRYDIQELDTYRDKSKQHKSTIHYREKEGGKAEREMGRVLGILDFGLRSKHTRKRLDLGQQMK